jgi:hypothetical protein
MKNIRKKVSGLMAILAIAASAPADAALTSVSGNQTTPPAALTEVFAAGPAANVAVSLANGFPIWYRDASGLKLELCIDRTAVKSVGGATFHPCLIGAPIESAPVSFPNNFGLEAFYWVAVAQSDPVTGLVSTVNGTNVTWNALFVAAQEASFFNLGTEGTQAVFARIRLRIKVPAPGTYRITHPFGTRDYIVSGAGAGDNRDINQTQDLGLVIGDTFLTSLNNNPVLPPPFPAPTPPSVSTGAVTDNGASIGPFLRNAAGNVAATVVTNGGDSVIATYLADPGTELAPLTVAINNGLSGVNELRIELIGDAAGNLGPAAITSTGIVLNPGAGNPNRVDLSQFQLSGKIFNDGPNTVPVVAPISVATGATTPVTIDVAPFVTDDISGTNVHGKNPQAISVYVSPTDMRRSASFTTANGGIVQRFTTTSTGKTVFTYTPAAGFAGLDSFQYVAQDTGGLISAPATVTVKVENLAASAVGAIYRPKFGKLTFSGTSTETVNNTITLATDPIAVLSGASVVPPVTSQAKGTFSLIAGRDTIKYDMSLSPLPTSAITSIHINAATAGNNGPVLFVIYDVQSGPVSFPLKGELTATNLIPRPNIGINNFNDAVTAILQGNAYVNIITDNTKNNAVPGELRGQLIKQNLGSTTVASDGSWKLNSKRVVNPLAVRGVNAVSSNGVRLLGVPLSVR